MPPYSTNGRDNENIINDVSLNLFTGRSGGVNAFEAGGFLNIDKYFVKGVQLAGFGNIVGDNVSGIQLAGFGNIVGDDMSVANTNPDCGDQDYNEIAPYSFYENTWNNRNQTNVQTWAGILGSISF